MNGESETVVGLGPGESAEESAGEPFGTHRVVSPPGVLPQPAWKLDNRTTRQFETEILVDVTILNLDAASFRQMEEATGSLDGVAACVLATVAERGKQHNAVTGSGGMLLGRVARVGQQVQSRGLRAGDRIATLASLTLTPLRLDTIRAVRAVSAQLDVVGQAIVFASAPVAKLPADLPDALAVALLDVAGAAPQTARLVGPGDTVLILGAGGKSGLLCAAAARRAMGSSGRLLGLESFAPFAEDARRLGFYDNVRVVDARDPLTVRAAVLDQFGEEVDACLSCVNVTGVEIAAVIATRPRGKAYFFAMTTSFAAAALGAEGIGKDVDLFIGNGFAEGHADDTFNLIRTLPDLRALFTSRYASGTEG